MSALVQEAIEAAQKVKELADQRARALLKAYELTTPYDEIKEAEEDRIREAQAEEKASIYQRVTDLESEIAELKELINSLLEKLNDSGPTSSQDSQSNRLEDQRSNSTLSEVRPAVCKPSRDTGEDDRRIW